MSLIVKVSANDTPLFWVTAQRQPGGEGEAPDSVNSYRVKQIHADGRTADLGLLPHRYGAGAAALAEAALGRAAGVARAGERLG